MKPKSITHSKVKNTGILFEILVRQITLDAMNGITESFAMQLLRKYFNPTRELGKELQLYQAFNNSTVLSEIKAVQFIDLILKRRTRLDEKKLLREKYDLVRELKEHYDVNTLLNFKLPNYKLLASIYKTFLAEVTSDDILNFTDVASAKFTLIEHLSSDRPRKKTNSTIYEEVKKQPEDLRLLTYKVMLEKFNEKHRDLNTRQKKLLREYINHVANSSTLLTFVKSEIPKLQEELINLSKNENDKVIQIKLREVADLLHTILNRKEISDSDITALMIAYQIADEAAL
jgi:CRISPR/Cas system-associated endoribonuclease Cas2